MKDAIRKELELKTLAELAAEQLKFNEENKII